MARRFNRDYGVFICEHIFQNTRPVLLCVRDDDGSYQFLCGDDHSEDDEPHLVGVGHLLDRDPTLEALAELDGEMIAARAAEEAPWEFGSLSDE